MEYCIVSWKGIGGSLFIETKTDKKKLQKKAFLEDVVSVLDNLSSKGGWIVRSAMSSRGKVSWTLSTQKGKTDNSHRKHLIVYWGGKETRIEIYPTAIPRKQRERINTNSSTLKDALSILMLLSKKAYGGWVVVSSSSGRQTKMWTLVSFTK